MPEYLIGQARKATYQARKLSNAAVGQLSPKLAFKVFDSQILPILEYGSQLWYKAQQNHRLETFHLGYLKRTIGFALHLRRNLNVIKYWLRMLNLQADDPLRNAFDTLVQLHNLGQSNWWTEVTTLLASLEISDPESHELNLANKNNKLLDTLKEKVHSTHMENCMARIKSNIEGKLRIFRTFKQDYCMEGYLLLLPNLKHMSTIARFRMSSHTLAIETGRHAKPKIAKEERRCRYCNLDDVEDEKHFLLKCPLYNEERLSLFNSVVLNVSAMSQGDVFVYLLSSKEPTTIKALGTFLHNAFMKREKAMNHYQC